MAWMVAVVAMGWNRESPAMERKWLAVVLLAVAVASTVRVTNLLRREPDRLLTMPVVVPDVLIGIALVVCDGWVFGAGHSFNTSQSVSAAWPVVSVMSAGVAFGPLAGGVAGGVVGASRLFGTLANGVRDYTGGRVASLANTIVFTTLWGATAGWVGLLLRRAERQVASARAREEVGRTLHDTVLQTLALVERRARDRDPELADLARSTDRDLRAYLYGPDPAVDPTARGEPRPTLQTALRAAVDGAASRFGVRVELNVMDGDEPRARVVRALAGAVTESLNNAGKHAQATRIVVFADPDGDDGPFVSVRDNGIGFDHDAVPRRGIERSIRDRMSEVGGRVVIATSPGEGTEVRLWGPKDG